MKLKNMQNNNSYNTELPRLYNSPQTNLRQPYGQSPYQQPNSTMDTQTNGMGIAGFICSIASVILCWSTFAGVVLWLLGLTFSAIGMSQRPRGLAIAGLIISLISFLLFIIIAVIFLILSSIILY